jgi:phage replication initiation protein
MTINPHLRALIDWVAFTFKTIDLMSVYEILGIRQDEFVDMPNGLYGYRKQKRCGNIKILFDGLPDQGIHIEMTGQGCREYETYYGTVWPVLFTDIINNHGKFTRVDAAVDEIRYNNDKPYFTLAKLIRKVKRDECKSRFKKAKRVETIRIEGGKSEGRTIYFGSPTSSIQIRAYEKNHERQSEGLELEENLTTWNRLELQTRDDRAQVLVHNILTGDNLGHIFCGVINNYIDFVSRTDDTNKSRWPRTKWWDDFLSDVERLKLTLIAPDKTIESNKIWLEKQVAPSLGMQFIASGSDVNFLLDMVNSGMERLTDAQLQKAEEHIKKLRKQKSDSPNYFRPATFKD